VRVSTEQLFTQGLDAILDGQSRLARTQAQIASGKRQLTAADDPIAAKNVLDLNARLGLTRQHQTNADAVSSRLALEDSVLGEITDVLHRVRELAVQGNSATLTSADRLGIARELEERLESLLALANTQDGNSEFLFAGFKTRTRPFAADGAGGFSYSGDDGSRRLEVSPGVLVADADPGSRVFLDVPNGNGTFATREGTGNSGSGVIDAGSVVDPAAFVPDTYTITFLSATDFEVRDGSANLVASGTFESGAAIGFAGVEVRVSGTPAAGDTFTVSPSVKQDLFTTVQSMVDALRDPASDGAGQTAFANAMNRGLGDLEQALENLRGVRASVGARLNAVEAEREFNEDFAGLLESERSRIEDLDLAEAITTLNRQLAALEAASRSFARIQGLTLFELL